jgi:hypothetical protein
LGFAPARAARPEADEHGVCVRLADLDMARSLYVGVLSERVGDPPLSGFMDFVKSQVAAESPLHSSPSLSAGH